MTLHQLLIFLHVLGAVGMFAAWGMEAIVLGQIRRAVTLDEAGRWMSAHQRWKRLGPAAMLMALATGIGLMSLGWGHQPWMITAIAAIVLIVITGVTTERRVAARYVDQEGDTKEPLLGGTERLAASLTLRIAIGVAIIGLMTTKPGVVGSLVVLATGIGAGLGVSLGVRRRGGTHPGVVPATAVGDPRP